MRGVHGGAFVKEPDEPGSSPHARGPLQSDCHRFGNVRIIPAYAGSTDNNDVFRQVYIVHLKIPKICSQKIG